MIGLLGFVAMLTGIWINPRDRRSGLAMVLVVVGSVAMAHAGWRPFWS